MTGKDNNAIFAIVRILASNDSGVYVQFRDRKGKRKSESLTVPGITPKKAMREFARFLKTKLRKAS